MRERTYQAPSTTMPAHVGTPYPGRERGGANEVKALRWRVQVTVLWLVLASGMSAAMLLYLMEPGSIDKVRSGKVEGMDLGSFAVQVQFAIFWIVPWAMAFLTLVFRDTLDRWVNGVLGLVVASFYAMDVAGHMGDGGFTGEALVVILGALVGLLIVWHAWRWPTQGGPES